MTAVGHLHLDVVLCHETSCFLYVHSVEVGHGDGLIVMRVNIQSPVHPPTESYHDDDHREKVEPEKTALQFLRQFLRCHCM